MNLKILILILFVVGCTHVSEQQTNQTEENFDLEDYYSDEEVKEEKKVEAPLLTGGATKKIEDIQEEKKDDSGKVEAGQIVRSVKEQLVNLHRSLKVKENDKSTNETTIADQKINYEMARDMLSQAEKDLENDNYENAKKYAELAREMADKILL